MYCVPYITIFSINNKIPALFMLPIYIFVPGIFTLGKEKYDNKYWWKGADKLAKHLAEN